MENIYRDTERLFQNQNGVKMLEAQEESFIVVNDDIYIISGTEIIESDDIALYFNNLQEDGTLCFNGATFCYLKNEVGETYGRVYSELLVA